MEEDDEPRCPWRIVYACGNGFTVGLVGGGIFQAIKGFRNAPSGLINRVKGSIALVTFKAPTIASQFAVWSVIFSTINCTIVHFRRKDDPWNSIMSGAAASGIISVRNGVSAMVGGIVIGGAFLALIEGIIFLETSIRSS